ncbi:MAG: hypothetical protein ABIH99_03780, partial [Candidatus Micrarchaeota archaeon]
NSQEEASVEVSFTCNGEEYTVARRIKNGAANADLRKQEKLIETQAQRVTEAVEKLLGVDYELFTRAIYSEQNRIDYFLTLPRGERKNQIDELLGIDRFEKVRKNASAVLNGIRRMREEKELVLKGVDVASLGKESAEKTREAENLRAVSRELASMLEKLGGEKRRLETSFTELDGKRKKFREIADRKLGIEHTLESMKKEIAEEKEEVGEESRKKLEEEAKTLANARGEARKNTKEKELKIAELEKERGMLSRKLEEVETRAKRKRALEKELEGILRGEKRTEIEGEIVKLRSENEEKKQEIARAKAERNELEKALKELEKEIGKCPVCDTELNEEKKGELKRAKKDGVEQIAKELAKQEKESKEIDAKLASFEAKLQKSAELVAKITELWEAEGEKGEAEEKLGANEKLLVDEKEEKRKLEEKNGELEKNEKEVGEKLQKTRRFAEMRAKIAEFESELKKLAEGIEALKFEEKELEEIRAKLGNTRVEERAAQEKKLGVERELKQIEQVLELQKKRIEEYAKIASEIKKAEETAKELQIFQNCVVETQRILREEFVGAISSAMEEVWGVVYPYGDYASIRLQADEADYNLELQINGEWFGVDGVASGGERACACLAMRIAFAMVLVPNLSWLILDEPTHNLDDEAVGTLSSALRERIPNIVEQILVITHEERLKDAASAKLYKLERDKDAQGATQITTVA